MNVLCLTDSSLIGGAEMQMLALFRGIAAAGHDVHLLCSGDRFAAAARASGLEARALPWLTRPLRLWKAARATRRSCMRLRADVLHAEGVRTAAVAGLARMMLPRPPALVVTVHNLTDPGPLSYWVAATLLRATGGHLTTVSDSERRHYVACGFPATRCRTVHNGIDVPPPITPQRRVGARAALGIPAEALVVAQVGRLSPEKGHEILFRALAGLPSPGAPLRVLLAGEGPLRQALEAACDRLGLKERVSFLGFREDVSSILYAADLLVLPSLREAFPMVLLEAMAVGLPVIATPVGGVREVVVDNREGWLVDVGDASALRDTLFAALTDPQARSERGAAGRHRVEKGFSVGTMVAETLSVYESAAGTRRGSAR